MPAEPQGKIRMPSKRPHSLALAAALAASPVLVLALPAAASDLPRLELVYLAEAGGTLEVAPDGSVADVTVEKAIAEPLRVGLAAAIRKLHFEPVQVHGEAVRALTGFHVVLAGHPKDGNLSVEIDAIDFVTPPDTKPVEVDNQRSGAVALKMSPPKFPRDEERSGRMARVEVALRVSPDGRVADVQVVDSMLIDNGQTSSASASALRHFEQSALEAARGWMFSVPPDAAALAPAQLTVKTDIEYVFELRRGFNLHQHGQWLPMYRAPKRAVAWLSPVDAGRIAETAVAAGAVSNPGNPFRLSAPAAGTPVL
jgi:hypothetical protein